MPYIHLDYSDGQYSVKELASEDEVNECKKFKLPVAYVEDAILSAWKAHCDQYKVFQAMWRLLDTQWHRDEASR